MAIRQHQQQPHFEFCGPFLGPAGIIFGLPLVCYGLVYACNEQGCLTWRQPALPGWPPGTRLFTWQASAVLAGWFALQLGLHLLLPGQVVEGVQLPNGRRLKYKLNAWNNLLITAALVAGAFATGAIPLDWAAHNFVPLLTAAVLASCVVSVYLYLSSYAGSRLLAEGGNTGHHLYDFFKGRELNPRIGNLDLKQWCEQTPGMLGWAVLDWSMAYHQLQRQGYVSLPMLLVCAFQTVYVADSLWFEPAILTTMDIATDGFGFMLAFGDLVWVPFTYSLQARYLADHAGGMPWAAAAAVLALKAASYAAFRGANSQKDTFRRDPAHPAVRGLRSLQTRRGTRLIISGWWGLARHANYTADWLMGLAWCLPCGFGSPIPYFYVGYFAVLLVHRDRRDDHACRAKYGSDWDKYCSTVKWRLIPFLY